MDLDTCFNCYNTELELLYNKEGELKGKLCLNCDYINRDEPRIPYFDGQQISKGKRRKI